MPIAARFSYFDHAAVAPISRPAARAMSRFADQASQLGDTVWPQWNAILRTLRQQTAELVGADPCEICLIPNTTAGINLVAQGWPWKPGESVVIPEGEFPSNLFPWMNLSAKGVELRIVPRQGPVVSVEDLLDRCDDSTRLIAVSWVGYATGHRIDVSDLVHRAHQRGIAVFLDAIQGLGVYPLDLAQTPVDFVAADGHKWLLGPEGAGVAVIRQEHIDTLQATNVGWASVKEPHNYNDPQFELRDDATRFESGSANMAGAGALSQSMEILLQVRRLHGPEAIEQRILSLASDLNEQLLAVGATTLFSDVRKHQSGIVHFQLSGIVPAEFRKRAAEQDVIVSCRGNGIRASLHAYNNPSDIERLMRVVTGA